MISVVQARLVELDIIIALLLLHEIFCRTTALIRSKACSLRFYWQPLMVDLLIRSEVRPPINKSSRNDYKVKSVLTAILLAAVDGGPAYK
jgi:hypothetical protein